MWRDLLDGVTIGLGLAALTIAAHMVWGGRGKGKDDDDRPD